MHKTGTGHLTDIAYKQGLRQHTAVLRVFDRTLRLVKSPQGTNGVPNSGTVGEIAPFRYSASSAA